MYRPKHKSSSPFYEIRRILRVLRIVAWFPLQSNNCLFHEFLFKPHVEYCKIAIKYALGLSSCIYMFSQCFQLKNELSMNDCFYEYQQFLNKILDNRSVTWLDYTLFIFLICINVTFDLLHFWLFQTTYKILTKLCLELTETWNDIDITIKIFRRQETTKKPVQYAYKESLKLVLYSVISIVFIIFAYSCAVLWAHFTIDKQSESTFFDGTIYYVLKCIRYIFLAIPVYALHGELLSCHLINNLSEAFTVWNGLINTDFVEGAIYYPKDISVSTKNSSYQQGRG